MPLGSRLRLAGGSGIAGALVFTAGWLFAHALDPSVEYGRDYISNFGAATGEHPWVWNAATAAAGILILLLLAGLARALPAHGMVRLGLFALAAAGLGTFLDGLLPLDCPLPNDSGCRARQERGEVSWQHRAHLVESLITVGAFVVAPLALGRGLRGIDRWRPLAVPSLACGLILFVLAVALGVSEREAYVGVVQRVFAVGDDLGRGSGAPALAIRRRVGLRL